AGGRAGPARPPDPATAGGRPDALRQEQDALAGGGAPRPARPAGAAEPGQLRAAVEPPALAGGADRIAAGRPAAAEPGRLDPGEVRTASGTGLHARPRIKKRSDSPQRHKGHKEDKTWYCLL